MTTDAEKLAQITALHRCVAITRGINAGDYRCEVDGEVWPCASARILAEPGPTALTRDRLRTELAASLPADRKWVAWVDGVLDRLEATS